MEGDMPIYVRIEEYRDVLDVVHMIKNKMRDVREKVDKIQALKNDEDAELEKWEASLQQIEQRIEYIDKSLFEPESL